MWRARVHLVDQAVAHLYPGYFALVMATGIVSIASFLLGMGRVAWAFFRVNEVAYGILWLLTLVRLVRYPHGVTSDLTDHARGPGFFTVVAGTCVLGSQYAILAGDSTTATLLWALGIVLWAILTYTFFTAVTVRRFKPDLESGVNGAWLLVVVATQSVSTLGTQVAASVGRWQEVTLFFSLGMYLAGCMLYILIIALIFYRFTFFRLAPEDLTPPYWINMGAVAITTLAGATLILQEPQWGFLGALDPFLKGFTLFFWVTATWWIPLLLVLGVWRHLYHRVHPTYDPQYWGLVFPLGMYSACTFQLATATGLSFLFPLARYVLYIALIAWAVTFLGLVHRLISSVIIASLVSERAHE